MKNIYILPLMLALVAVQSQSALVLKATLEVQALTQILDSKYDALLIQAPRDDENDFADRYEPAILANKPTIAINTNLLPPADYKKINDRTLIPLLAQNFGEGKVYRTASGLMLAFEGAAKTVQFSPDQYVWAQNADNTLKLVRQGYRTLNPSRQFRGDAFKENDSLALLMESHGVGKEALELCDKHDIPVQIITESADTILNVIQVTADQSQNGWAEKKDGTLVRLYHPSQDGRSLELATDSGPIILKTVQAPDYANTEILPQLTAALFEKDKKNKEA